MTSAEEQDEELNDEALCDAIVELISEAIAAGWAREEFEQVVFEQWPFQEEQR